MSQSKRNQRPTFRPILRPRRLVFRLSAAVGTGLGVKGDMRVLVRHRGDGRSSCAFLERRELVTAGLTRRDLIKMGVLTGGGVGGALLVAERGLADDPGPVLPFRP